MIVLEILAAGILPILVAIAFVGFIGQIIGLRDKIILKKRKLKRRNR